MAKHTQTIRQQFADELFECVWPFCRIDVKGLRLTSSMNFTKRLYGVINVIRYYVG